jgi:hypothetical protein
MARGQDFALMEPRPGSRQAVRAQVVDGRPALANSGYDRRGSPNGLNLEKVPQVTSW